MTPRLFRFGLVLAHVTAVLRVPLELPHWELDNSHKMAAVEAFARHLFLGRDLAFTFGPLGFLYGRVVDPRTFHWLVLALLLVAAAYSWSWDAIRRAAGVPAWLVLAGSIAVLCLVNGSVDATVYGLTAMTVIIAFSLDDGPSVVF